jgi:hypothetical protein
MKPLPDPHLCPLGNRARRDLQRSRIVRSFLGAMLLCVAPAYSASAQTANSAVTAASFTGQLQDATGAIIPNAKVELRSSDGTVVAAALTDAAGHFRIPQPATGDYRLSVVLEGFEPLVRPVRITRAPLAPLTLTMNLASVSTSVTVNAEQNADIASPDQNKNTPTITSDDMKTLPILDGDVVSTLSAFLDAGASGEGGATLMVDGVEMKTLGVDPTAIERITINQDPYSARYRQPGRGQIEVTTKNTSEKFHGSLTFAFRDSALNAVNHFATTKPPEQRRTYGGYLTGPIKPLRDTTFLFSLNRREQNFSQQVNATTAPGVVTNDNVLAAARNTSLTMKVAHQINDNHSAYLLYRFFNGSSSNQNVGGLTLASAGYTSYNFDMDLTFHDDLDLTPNALNQFSILFERNIDRDVSGQQTPAIIVQGAFTGGGAQNDNLQTENNPNLSDIFAWTHKIHQIKFGVQLPNLGRRVIEDFANRQGTYTFASLAALQANTPLSFTLQQGQTRFLTHFDTPSAFFQDEIQATDRLTVTTGVRYDFQSTLPGSMDTVLPRLSLAYVLDKKHALVVRTGSGIYMRRVGVNIGQQLARYEYAAERSLLITSNICYHPGIVTPCTPLLSQPPSLFNFQPNIKAPMQGYFGLSIERQLTEKSTITLSYDGYRGWHALRSVDVNAPLPPFTNPARPNPNFAQILQLQSGGYQKSDSMTLSYRGRIGNAFSGFLDYVLQHADSNTQYSTFMPQNQYEPNDEWSRTSFDQRQQFKFFGTFYPDKPLTLGVGFYNYTPTPYTITTGTDPYLDGLTNARPPGVPRNSLNSGNFQDLQVRLGYTFKLQPHLKDDSPTIAFSISSFNTLNRTNYEGFVGVMSSPLFMQPTSADAPRRLQLGANYNF